MDNERIRELATIVIGAIILSLAILFGATRRGSVKFLTEFPGVFISFLIIIGVSILVKKMVAYYFESDITTKFWEFYRYGFHKGSHLIKPIPMIWLPIVLTILSKGTIWWLGILQFDIKPRPERASKRHGIYRLSNMTEWHIAVISIWGVIACLILSIIGYIFGFEQFAKLSIFYAVWSIVPFSNLDGSKIFFGNRALWTAITIITGLFLAAALVI